MPRRSLAVVIAKEVMATESKGGGKYIVVYDFPRHIPTRFYRNLEALIGSTGGATRIQKSVYIVEGRGTAEALRRLVEHYGGSARIFKICSD